MSKPKSQQARFDMRISHEFSNLVEDWRRRQYPKMPSKTQAIEFLCRASIAADVKYKPENADEVFDNERLVDSVYNLDCDSVKAKVTG